MIWRNFFGHMRLSIQDLSQHGAQPMKSYCGNYIIVFNGEIYNHHHLRKKLNDNFNFNNWRSTSDTETLINYISFFGINKTLEEIDGMYSFVLYDFKKKKKISFFSRQVWRKAIILFEKIKIVFFFLLK